MAAEISAAWAPVAAVARAEAGRRITEHFVAEPDRAARFTATGAGLTLDLSRARMSEAGRRALLDFAATRQVEAARDRMLAGEPVNTTEGRAAHHTALRADPTPREVQAEAARAAAYAEELRGGGTRAVLWLGIGGSDLGPRMVCDALAAGADGPEVRFVSNVDGAALDRALTGLDPATTRIVVVSKSFSTLETMINARSARAWMAAALGEAETGQRMAAVSASVEKAQAFGIAPERVFAMWDWVGGRFSLWSAVGLAIRIALGNPAFDALLAGAREMDTHFAEAPLESNLPVLLALSDIWNVNALGLPSLGICPYADGMGLFVPYLQQLMMESNGKRVGEDGAALPLQGAPVIWGVPGTDCQHSVFQWMHQSPAEAPAEFLLPVAPEGARAEHQEALMANCLAQASALMLGRDRAATAALGGDPALV
ncbi:MAG: glucose-6-phosphate isomerase, partial [Pseudomonadota bacterium]